jgi:biotin transport system ATP-binding protein
MITCRELTHRYDGSPAVENVSLTIDDESVVLLAGPNGSGKTTLIRHFNGLLEPDSGSVSVDGHDVVDEPVAARTRVGMVFQSPRDQFVAATVGADVAFGPENLGLDRAEIDRRVADSLAAVNMEHRDDDRIDALSGGEQARVAVAGALAMGATHLVLDEPFAGLDAPARESLLRHLDALAAGGTTLVVVTHDLRDLTARADRLLVMDGGRIVEDDEPSVVLDRLDEHGVRDPRC